MADKRLKAWLADIIGQRAFDGFYRLVYNIISLLLLLPLPLVLLSGGSIIWQVSGVVSVIFVGLQIVGFIGVIVSILQIDALRFAGLRQIIAYISGDPLPLPDEPLKTSGLYAYMRHPLYFFSLLLIWFTPQMTTYLLVLNLCITAYFVIGSRIEEKRLIDYYGDAYRHYQEQVPWLIPNVKKVLSKATGR